MIAMCCRLPSTKMSATMTSADANPSPSATHARSSNQLGAMLDHCVCNGVDRGEPARELVAEPVPCGQLDRPGTLFRCHAITSVSVSGAGRCRTSRPCAVRAVTVAQADEGEPEDRKAPDSRAGTLHTALDRKGVPTPLRSAFFKRLFYRNY